MARGGREVWRIRCRFGVRLLIGIGTLGIVLALLILPKAQALVTTLSTAALAVAHVTTVVLRWPLQKTSRDGAALKAEGWDPGETAT
jgi:hypothetical protein